jgi:hypothetical protein
VHLITFGSNATIPSSYKSQEDSNLIYSAFAYIV